MPEHDLFGTADLFEGKDLMQVGCARLQPRLQPLDAGTRVPHQVLICVQSLGRMAQRVEGYSGPALGVRVAEKQVRSNPVTPSPPSPPAPPSPR